MSHRSRRARQHQRTSIKQVHERSGETLSLGFPPLGVLSFLKGSEKFRVEPIEGMDWLPGRELDYSQAQTKRVAIVA